jgi:extracellular factor (EF) 3-hydroxypalmitic acid methyl ester biosynthesis protein
MHDERFFDQTLALIEAGEVTTALPLLAGTLSKAHAESDLWPATRAIFRQHPLCQALLEDPFAAYSVQRPRGYPGDAGLIDIIYDQLPYAETTSRGLRFFDVSIGFPAAEAVRLRRQYAAAVVDTAWRAGQRVLVLACGHFREGDALTGEDMSGFTLVDQDAESLARVLARHADRLEIHQANVFRYLRGAAMRGERFDLVYTLGLNDYLDVRSMQLLHEMVVKCLKPGGTFLLANFLPHHLGAGWMDAVMDWQLICRDEAELESYARHGGMRPRTWRDQTGAVVWCEMVKPG